MVSIHGSGVSMVHNGVSMEVMDPWKWGTCLLTMDELDQVKVIPVFMDYLKFHTYLNQ